MSSTAHTDPLTDLLRQDPPATLVSDRVALQLAGDVAIVTLAKPDALNALSLASWRRLLHIFHVLAEEDGLRAVVIRGAGARAFAAGADIKEFPHTRMTAAAAIDYGETIAGVLRAIADLPLPVIAAVHGLAVGGGCELLAACDVRIASADARFGIPIGRLGVILGYTETLAVARLIGPAELKHLLFTGELITAQEAVRIGLVQRITEPDELMDAVAALVARIREQSAVTLRAAKVVTGMVGRPLTDTDAEVLARLVVEVYEGPDLAEGVAAFAERRDPVFSRPEEA